MMSTKDTVEYISIARKQGFVLLSDNLVDRRTKYKWKCVDGHIWQTTFDNINNGGKCPRCSGGMNEEKTRFIFEQLTGEKFPSNWKILNNRLQLDGYCENLKVAFEYQGIQHYQFNSLFHKSLNDFKNQQKRDRRKTAVCLKKEIIKIDVPYKESSSHKRLTAFIYTQLISHNIRIVRETVNWDNFIRETNKLQKLQEVAKSKDITLLSKQYWGSHHKHNWKCDKCNYEWSAKAKDVRDKSGCAKCWGNAKKTVEDMHELAKSKNLIFLSTEYIGALSKSKWRCKKCGYIRISHANNIQQNRGCPSCSGNLPLTMDDVREYENKRNITFVSKKFINGSARHEWECNLCHYKWKTTLGDIKSKTGCLMCANENKRLHKSDIDKLAQERGLILLSEKYYGPYEIHRWKCIKCNHISELKSSNVRRGTSCRKCGPTRTVAKLKRCNREGGDD